MLPKPVVVSNSSILSKVSRLALAAGLALAASMGGLVPEPRGIIGRRTRRARDFLPEDVQGAALAKAEAKRQRKAAKLEAQAKKVSHEQS